MMQEHAATVTLWDCDAVVEMGLPHEMSGAGHQLP
jgi:hypothetical protein